MSHLEQIEDWSGLIEQARYRAGELAAICGISDSQLRRFFRRRIGKSPQETMNEIRLWRSVGLLCSGLRVKEVAGMLHFYHAAVFC
jgi:AraC-like DNA-binding protein